MRILQINTTANWGSTGRIANDIGDALILQGHESSIAYGRYASPCQSQLIRIGSLSDVLIHGIYTRLTDRHGWRSKHATRKFIKTIEQYKPDLIHLHNIHGYYLHLPTLFHYLTQQTIPIVWTLHDCWAFTGHCSYFTEANCNKWETECHTCPLLHTYPATWLRDASKKNYRDKQQLFTALPNLNIVCVSKWLTKTTQQSFLHHFPIHTIYNGIDLKTFSPQNIRRKTLQLPEEFIVLGVANKWSQNKGLDDFIKLKQILPKNIHIVLIGLTPKQIKRLPEGIIGRQQTNSIEELAAYYSTADVYVSPSKYETFGMTIAESQACGTPTIIYENTALPELIAPNTGILVHKQTPEKLAEAILKIQDVGKTTFTQSCRTNAVKLYDKNRLTRQYLQLYQQLINPKSQNLR